MKLDRIAIAAGAFMLIAIIGSLVYWWYSRDPDDIRIALADTLGLPADQQRYFFLNLPPRSGRYPGSIFPGDPTLPAFEVVAADDADLLRSAPVTFTTKQQLSDGLDGRFAGAGASILAEQRRAGNIAVEIDGLRVIEIPSAVLKTRLLASTQAIAAAARGTEVYAITYAYEGTVTLSLKGAETVETASELSADELGKFNLELSREGESELVYASATPVVFAFQAVAADYIMESLDPLPEDVEFTRVEAEIE